MFIISKDGTTAVDTELVTAIRIDNREDRIAVQVRADGIWITMATFNGDNKGEHQTMAKAFLAGLVEMLNEGGGT